MSEKNQLANYKQDQIASVLLNKIINNNAKVKLEVTEAQRECGYKAILELDNFLKSEKLNMYSEDLNKESLNKTIITVMGFEIDLFAPQKYGYFEKRSYSMGKDKWDHRIDFKLQGDGYDYVARKFGRGIKNIKYIPIREGDDFEAGGFDGSKEVPPKWRLNIDINQTKEPKVKALIAIIEKQDGTTEYITIPRYAITKSLVAQIKQTVGALMSDQELNELNDMGLDEILDKYRYTTLKKTNTYKGQTYEKEINVLLPTWRLKHNQESMVIRKMKNEALKKFVAYDYQNQNNSVTKMAIQQTVTEGIEYDEDLNIIPIGVEKQEPEIIDNEEEFKENANFEEIKVDTFKDLENLTNSELKLDEEVINENPEIIKEVEKIAEEKEDVFKDLDLDLENLGL